MLVLTKLDTIHIEEAFSVNIIIIVIGNLVKVLLFFFLDTQLSLSSSPPVLPTLLPEHPK